MDLEEQNKKQRLQHPLANYQFSSDELRVLRECNTDSFFQRSLPLGTGFGLAMYFGIQRGFLQPNIKYGAVPKVIVGVVVGYFMGKFSYQKKCAEKIMRLPNSKLGEVLRQRKQGNLLDTFTSEQGIGTGLSLSPFATKSPDIYSDEFDRSNKTNTLNTDVESRPVISGLDDIYRPSLDNPSPQIDSDLPLETTKQGTSYDELRKQNREEYWKKQQLPRAQSLSPEEYDMRSKTQPMVEIEMEEAKLRSPTNKYGDKWTN